MSNHGRPANASEFNQLVQSTVAEHEQRLVRKGREEVSKKNFGADEQLVVTAAFDAIVNRREVTIMTSDTDVFEQFVKLMKLFDWQFQAMLFAERYSTSPESYGQRPLTRITPELRRYFADDEGVLIRKPCHPDRFFNWLVPKDLTITPVYCLLFGGNDRSLKFTPLDFTAVAELVALFEIKGKTFGRNTDRLADFNCHVVGYPVGILDPREWVVIGHDNSETDGYMRYPLLDIAHANHERR